MLSVPTFKKKTSGTVKMLGPYNLIGVSGVNVTIPAGVNAFVVVLSRAAGASSTNGAELRLGTGGVPATVTQNGVMSMTTSGLNGVGSYNVGTSLPTGVINSTDCTGMWICAKANAAGTLWSVIGLFCAGAQVVGHRSGAEFALTGALDMVRVFNNAENFTAGKVTVHCFTDAQFIVSNALAGLTYSSIAVPNTTKAVIAMVSGSNPSGGLGVGNGGVFTPNAYDIVSNLLQTSANNATNISTTGIPLAGIGYGQAHWNVLDPAVNEWVERSHIGWPTGGGGNPPGTVNSAGRIVLSGPLDMVGIAGGSPFSSGNFAALTLPSVKSLPVVSLAGTNYTQIAIPANTAIYCLNAALYGPVNYLVHRLGPAAGAEISGYVGVWNYAITSSAGGANLSTEFYLCNSQNTPGVVGWGCLVDPANNEWVFAGSVYSSGGGGANTITVGQKTLAGPLALIQVIGAVNFTAGKVSGWYMSKA